MNISHNVSDLIIRIKNASLSNRRETLIPFSNMNKKVLDLLAREGFVSSVKIDSKDKRNITVGIRYDRRVPIINGVNVLSKPSLRIYGGTKGIHKIERRGRHVVFVSTNQGIMTGKDAKKKGIGGEILFEIW
jgi:small subunit ribosomal protein S8